MSTTDTEWKKKKYSLVAICGKSATGKDTFLSELLKYSDTGVLNKKVSYTSRPMREGEVNGLDYRFVDGSYFSENAEKFIEQEDFRGWQYGTSIDSLSENCLNVGIFTPSGIERLKALYPNIRLLVVEIQAPLQDRVWRSMHREKYPNYEEICRRLIVDEIDFKDFKPDFVVFNDSLEHFYDAVPGILKVAIMDYLDYKKFLKEKEEKK